MRCADGAARRSVKSNVPAAVVVLVKTGAQFAKLVVISITHVRFGPADIRNGNGPPASVGTAVRLMGGLRALRKFSRPPVTHFPVSADNGSVPSNTRRIIC